MAPRPTPALRRAATQRFATPVGGNVLDIKRPAPAETAPPEEDAPQAPPVAPPPPMQIPNLSATQRDTVPYPYAFALVTDNDLDTLWDWARADREGTSAFLGAEFPNSKSLFQRMDVWVAQDRAAKQWFRAVHDGRVLVGFASVMFVAGGVGHVSVYIEPGSRAATGDVVAVLAREFPASLGLVVITSDDQLIAAFSAVGFDTKTLLTRPANSKDGVPSTPHPSMR